MRRDLRQLTEALREGKVTERKKATDELSRWFRVPQNVAKIGNNNNDWLEIFEALAVGAKAEHDATGKKASSASTLQTKLENISAAFRVTVESSIPYLNNASIEFLIPRIVAIMRSENALVDATGSNYARTLLSVVSYPPHVRSFTDKTWQMVCRLAWAVLLNDRVSDKHSWAEDDPKQNPRTTASTSTIAAARASPVQLIFATILRHLCASPFAPLVERDRRSNEPDVDDQINWARYILVKFCRYFEMYQGSVTSHVDMIPALCHVLEQVELNRIADMMWFSRKIWPLLVTLMKGRVRTDYVQLLVIFKYIVPYYVRTNNDNARAEAIADIIDSNSFKGLTDLVQVVDEYAPLKAGLEILSLESLRLEFAPLDEDVFTGFRAKTFRHGRAFTASQAHAWAVLELQADCVFYLYRQEETTPHSQIAHEGPPVKRRRSENALEVLLNGLKSYSSPAQGLFRLQVLLFLIDRRWDFLDITHQQLILNALFRLSVVDDATDAFALLCLVSITVASNKTQGSPTSSASFWSNLWAHGYRRLSSTSSPVSRAACHLLSALLKWNRVDSNMIGQYIGQFARDFREDEETAFYDHPSGVEGLQQGRSLNRQSITIYTMSESSCALLAQFIAFADADAALCRLQLEDAVRKWLRKCMNRALSIEKYARGTITTGKGNKDSERLRKSAQKADAHVNTQDLLSILQAVCGLTIRPTFKCDTRLPDDDLVRAITVYQADRTLRRFVLEAMAPEFARFDDYSTSQANGASSNSQVDSTYDGEFSSLSGFTVGDMPPSTRESKTLATLEEIIRKIPGTENSIVGAVPDNSQDETPLPISSSGVLEKSVVALKLVAAVLGVQACLEINNTRPSRDLYRLAFDTLRSVIPWQSDDHEKYGWTANQWSEIMCELRPLTCVMDPLVDPCRRQIEQFLHRPGNGSGIKRELVRKLAPDPIDSLRKAENERNRHLLHTIWSQKTASDCLSAISESLHALLQLFSDKLSQGGELDMDRYHENPFGTSTDHDGLADSGKLSGPSDTADTYFASISVAYIATSSAMSKDVITPQPDPKLEQLILESEGLAFLTLGQAYCHCMQARTLHASPATAKDILIALNSKLKTWNLWRSETMHILVFLFLDTLSSFWLQDDGELKSLAQKLLPRWTMKKVVDGGSWKSRNAFSIFMGKMMLLEAFQRWWKDGEGGESMDVDEATESQDEDNPLNLLGDMMLDGDIRVRVSSSILFPTVFVHAGTLEQDIMTLFEGMLSRFLALANTMIVSSPLRRGVYWHLLETTLEDSHYTQYSVALLTGIATRLGLPNHQALFCAYSGQIAVLVRGKPADFLQLPPRTLGFRTHKECADLTLSSVVPSTIIRSYEYDRGEGAARPSVLEDAFFVRYCKAIRREPVDALRECFTQIIASSIIFDTTEVTSSKSKSRLLRDWLLRCASDCDSGIDPREYIKMRADSISAAILCYDGDIDYQADGGIVQALRHSVPEGGTIAKSFMELQRFRKFDDFPMHMVNFPAASTEIIIKSLGWFTDTFVGELEDSSGVSTIYHAIHHLFTAVYSTPLVNEQLRYIHSLTLWLSVSSPILVQGRMIHTILAHSIALLSHEDLTHSAQSIITWALDRARRAGPQCQDISIGTFISRIAELSVRFSRSKDQKTSTIGFQLLEWVEAELQKLCEIEEFREDLQAVVTLWPRALHIRQDIFSQDSTENATMVLARGDTNPIGRFRVVRHLNAIPMYATRIFATEHFWTLKGSIPADDLLMREDLNAFMELLYKDSGNFHSTRIEAPEDDGLALRHRSKPEKDVKYIIATWLLSQTTVATADSLHMIHQALRRLCHPSCGVPLSTNELVLFLFRAGSVAPLQAVECDTSFFKRPTSPELSSNYGRWLCDTTVFLSQLLSKVDIFYAQLIPMLAANIGFAGSFLPILVHQLLVSDTKGLFGHPIRPIISDYLRAIMHSNTTDTSVLQAIVDLILHLRNFQPHEGDPVGYDKWLDLDFLDLCKTSLKCGAYTTSLLFLELAQGYRSDVGEQTTTGRSNEWEREKEAVLYEIYRHIDELDGFYAIEGTDISKHLMQKFHHENKWDKAFQCHVAQFEVAQSGSQPSGSHQSDLSGVVESLHSYGFSHLALSLARGSPANTSTDFMYSLAWRTNAWDLPQALNSASRNASLYAVIRAVHRGKEMEFTKLLCESAARQEMQNLRNTNPENVVEIRKAIQSLLCLREIRNWVQDWRQLQSESFSSPSKSFKKFFTLSPDLDFGAAEGIVATRISLIRSLVQSVSSQQIGNMEASTISRLTELETRCLVDLAANARMSNIPQVAFNVVSRAQQMSPVESFHISTEFAEALWTQQEHAMAIQFLTKLVRQKFPSQGYGSSSKMDEDLGPEEVQEWARLYARLGSWTTAACFASPQDIRTMWFDPGVRLLDPLNQIRRRTAKTVYYEYASFANKQLRQMERSDEYKRLKKWSIKVKAEIEELEQSLSVSRSDEIKTELRRRKEKSERLLETDNKTLEEHEAAVKSFLQQAISMYAHYMEASDSLDQEIAVRFCGLWFAYFDNDIAAESIRHALPKISPHKLLFLSHQLTARLGSPNESEKRSQRFLKQIVEAMCFLHPFHSLFQVLSMKGLESSSPKTREESVTNETSKRSEEAKRIIESVRIKVKEPKSRRPDGFMEVMEESFSAYIEWAHYPIKKLKQKTGNWYPIPRAIVLYQWTWDGKSKDNKPKPLCIPVMTADIPIEANGEYRNIPTIHWYERRYTVAGGVHVPKINICVDSLGRQHKQLFKGEGGDDLRQDAVMEQVFELVNIMLAQDRESKRRELSILGHILGLGDRHMSNLLMDAHSGEMIHIDLGIAFDQGRLLPIPELVPFRLTADVVDGMGIAGTEGVYRKCSEQTLRVLREGSDIIKTVLEVFGYDPLHIWTATPDKLRRIQDGAAESAADVVQPPSDSDQMLQGADRAINSVSHKLDTTLSVEYTVNELINAAQNPANLARIFYGWSPQC
ncbi:hypothetical protein M408DRAFT_14239 [Serendipita vermifera MAFF 305830]|uniref:Serine/threonine-protein kinase TEL1 n=1 Tax=Serendipita vermifera MAFF 305830 TaxID=933852 RepID=A0A0C2XXG7_SERVB|nr:hypothetical protein M408DRAFT_14239 [Serendipita vermifera MAFF 305830]